MTSKIISSRNISPKVFMASVTPKTGSDGTHIDWKVSCKVCWIWNSQNSIISSERSPLGEGVT